MPSFQLFNLDGAKRSAAHTLEILKSQHEKRPQTTSYHTKDLHVYCFDQDSTSQLLPSLSLVISQTHAQLHNVFSPLLSQVFAPCQCRLFIVSLLRLPLLTRADENFTDKTNHNSTAFHALTGVFGSKLHSSVFLLQFHRLWKLGQRVASRLTEQTTIEENWGGGKRSLWQSLVGLSAVVVVVVVVIASSCRCSGCKAECRVDCTALLLA